MDSDTKGTLALGWVIFGVADLVSLWACNHEWTRESGYGWIQGLYNWSMLFFWFTALPLLLIIGYYFVKACIILYTSARDSYSEFKRRNT